MANVLQAIIRRNNDSPGGDMSIIDHIEALRWHIIRSLLAVITFSVVAYLNIEWLFDHVILGPAKSNFISYRAMCYMAQVTHISALCLQDFNLQFQNTEMSGQFMMSFSISFMLGFILAFPYVFFELWLFIKPALQPKELKAARGIVFWMSLLFFTGVLFAYFVIAPFTINFFASYQLSPSFQNIITIGNYFDTICDLVLGSGVVFELPVAVYFLSRIGLVTPELMRTKRKYSIVIILIIAAVITPPDWLSIWLVAVPLLALYEIGIKISARAALRRV